MLNHRPAFRNISKNNRHYYRINFNMIKVSSALLKFHFLKKSSTPPKFESIYVYRLKAFDKLIKISLNKLLRAAIFKKGKKKKSIFITALFF